MVVDEELGRNLTHFYHHRSFVMKIVAMMISAMMGLLDNSAESIRRFSDGGDETLTTGTSRRRTTEKFSWLIYVRSLRFSPYFFSPYVTLRHQLSSVS